MASYRSEILAELRRARFADHGRNYDPELGLEPPPAPGLLRERLREARRLGGAVAALRPVWQYWASPNAYFSAYAQPDLDRGEYLHGRLADARSRALLVKLIAHRVLGHRKVRLPRATPEHRAMLADVDRYATAEPPMQSRLRNLVLPLFDTAPLGHELRLHSTGPNVARAFGQKQYEYRHGDALCRVEPGDVVVDAGAGWGESTLYLADEAGPSGVCVSLEFVLANLQVLRRNLSLNPALAGRIRLVESPAWSAGGTTLSYVDWGPRSRVSDDPARYGAPDGEATSVTIDETLEGLGLKRVDFMRLDVGGAELDALKGAEASIRKHRPKLAISLHHRPEDFTEIPRYIDSLKLGYAFYLDHHTLHQAETVLFAVPQAPAMEAAYALHTGGRLAEAEARYRAIIADEDHAPDGMGARNNLLALYRDQGRFDEAETLIRDAVRVAPADPQWNHRLATALLRKGEYLEAWPLYEHRIRLSSHWPMISRLPGPQWQGQPVGSLLVWPEQDLGDTILFARYLPLIRARGVSITLVCQPLLAALMAPLADEVIPLAGAIALPTRDAWAMLGSLPGLFGTTRETIPPPPPFGLPSEGGAGIGVTVGPPGRTPPPGSPGEAARRLLGRPGAVDLDAGLQGSDFLAAARTLAGMAEVVSANTPLAHLSAALGKPTRILLPRNSADWRWLADRHDSPWYPAVTLVRESADGGWDTAL